MFSGTMKWLCVESSRPGNIITEIQLPAGSAPAIFKSRPCLVRTQLKNNQFLILSGLPNTSWVARACKMVGMDVHTLLNVGTLSLWLSWLHRSMWTDRQCQESISKTKVLPHRQKHIQLCI